MRSSCLTILALVWGAAGTGWIGPTAADDISVIRATRIHPAPDAAPIDDAVVVIRDGRIAAVGPRRQIQVPSGARPIQCAPGVVLAGFQNSHVHFIETRWEKAAEKPAAELAVGLTEMLTRYGFTTVLDTASNPDDTLALRRRIESGEIAGPRILTAGLPLYPHNGIPIYLRDLPPEFLARQPQPATVEEAVQVVRTNLDAGADATKLFVATPQGNGKVMYMSREIAAAAVQATHARQRLVIAHPTDNEGIRIAIDSGVDVLAHTTIDEIPAIWSPQQIQDMVTHRLALVPTLKLWPYEAHKAKLPSRVVDLGLGDVVRQVRDFAAAGGQVLFGTDVGYMSDYDPTDEYIYMSRALTPAQILASLTTAPADRWQESDRRGRVAPGMQADLVVLGADPMSDVRHFADVRCTLRQGRVIYSRP